MPLPDVQDTYRLILRQSFTGQEMLNVFYYRDTSLVAPAPTDVATDWWTAIKVAWRNWQVTSANALTTEVECEKLFDDHAFGIFPIPVAEQQGVRAGSGDFFPPTLAALITLQVGTRLTRPGSKRIAYLTEGDVGGGSNLAAGSLAVLQALADVLDQPFTATPPGAVMHPVIVGYPTPLQPGGPRVQDITDAVASGFVSHQVSRDARP